MLSWEPRLIKFSGTQKHQRDDAPELPREDSGPSCSAEVSTYYIAEKPRTSLGTPTNPSVSSTVFKKFPRDHSPPNLPVDQQHRSVAQVPCALAMRGVHHCPSGFCTGNIFLWSKVMSGQHEGCRPVRMEVFRAWRTSQRAVLIILPFRR